VSVNAELGVRANQRKGAGSCGCNFLNAKKGQVSTQLIKLDITNSIFMDHPTGILDSYASATQKFTFITGF